MVWRRVNEVFDRRWDSRSSGVIVGFGEPNPLIVGESAKPDGLAGLAATGLVPMGEGGSVVPEGGRAGGLRRKRE